MVTFQKDFLNIIRDNHALYLNKIQKIFSNNDLLENLTIEDAENLIEYIKEYNKIIYSAGLVLDKINNIKKYRSIQEKIDNELFSKILPIMSVYRTLLLEKYRDELTIHDLD
tara:strand:- start:117 stop:452 length:336 start_codon:yes stop_codon:yes gene_type:complete